jgi:hypothetical protein
MRIHRYVVAVLAIGTLVAAGCWYQQPRTDEMYAKVTIGMSKDEVVQVLGQPTAILGNDLFYIYDDPDEPVRLRFVLSDKGFVTEKYVETKKDLAKRAEETEGKVPPTQPLQGEEKRSYPGGPLDRFGKKSSQP